MIKYYKYTNKEIYKIDNFENRLIRKQKESPHKY